MHSRSVQGCGSLAQSGKSASLPRATGRSSIATSNFVRVPVQAPDSKSIFPIVILTFFPVSSESDFAMTSSMSLTACIFKE